MAVEPAPDIVGAEGWRGRHLIFLLSQPRAGSTLLQQMLAAHPDVHTLPEPWIMLLPAYALRRTGLEAEFNARVAGQALREFLARLPDKEEAYYAAVRRHAGYLYAQALAGTGRRRFLDKTPRYYLILPELARIFPEARFVLLLRNPLAVLASVLDTWVVNHNWNRLAASRDDLMAAPRLLADGMDALGDRACVVRYEGLVRQPEQTMQTLCQGLDLDFHAGMLEFGGATLAEGSFGDKITAPRLDRPTAARLDLWVERLAQPDWRRFAEAYLAALGPALLARLGYSYDELFASLRSRPAPRPFLSVPWAVLMKPPRERTLRERAQVRLVVALRQRGLVGALLHGLRKALGAVPNQEPS